MPRGQRHLVKCKCVLPQFKSRPNPPVHKFVVFSVVQDDDTVVTKFAQCNNCGCIHKVTDICTSEVLKNKDSMASVVTIDDIKSNLPPNLSDILERHNVEVSSWEQAQYIYENKEWGNFVLLAGEEEGGTRQGKYVRIMSETFFKVEGFTREEVATLKE
jgi:hypothetical protein